MARRVFSELIRLAGALVLTGIFVLVVIAIGQWYVARVIDQAAG